MIYVTADLHGYLDSWKRLMKKIRFTEDDTMFVLGDLVDCGPDPMGLVNELMTYPNVFPVLGNHDLRFARCVRPLPPEANTENFLSFLNDEQRDELTEWVKEGGHTTLAGFLALDSEEREAVLDYISEMTLYEEAEADGVSFVLTHSGIDGFSPDTPLDDYPMEAFLNALPRPGDEYFADKTVIVGHIPTYKLDESMAGKILDDGAIIYIDCGASHPDDGGRLGCLRLDDFEEFYA
ncbi:MAG: metallophosphoesterase [Butyricicoccaceae bacterium]